LFLEEKSKSKNKIETNPITKTYTVETLMKIKLKGTWPEA